MLRLCYILLSTIISCYISSRTLADCIPDATNIFLIFPVINLTSPTSPSPSSTWWSKFWKTLNSAPYNLGPKLVPSDAILCLCPGDGTSQTTSVPKGELQIKKKTSMEITRTCENQNVEESVLVRINYFKLFRLSEDIAGWERKYM